MPPFFLQVCLKNKHWRLRRPVTFDPIPKSQSDLHDPKQPEGMADRIIILCNNESGGTIELEERVLHRMHSRP
jgi:hypothetical protein